jgi:hypothetical protein
MSVDQAKKEIDFIIEFHGHVKQMIGIVQDWEAKDAKRILANSHTMDIKDIQPPDDDRVAFETARITISIMLVQYLELSKRYDVPFSDNLLFVIPTNGRDIQFYRYSFPEAAKEPVPPADSYGQRCCGSVPGGRTAKRVGGEESATGPVADKGMEWFQTECKTTPRHRLPQAYRLDHTHCDCYRLSSLVRFRSQDHLGDR